MNSLSIDKIQVRILSKNERIPYDLLLVADPSTEVVDHILVRGTCYVAEYNEQTIGV